MTTGMKTGGELVVASLLAQGVDRIFSVPGESFLAVLDALHGAPIQNFVTRQEGGAAMMAEAEGKLTGRPGIAFVTRGPGATNAAAGVHIAKQDSTPMILFVGQIGRRMRGREAFQEVDYRQTFGDLAKWVEEIDHADRVPEIIAHAYHVAMSGRPGPVVLALPEDMLRERATATIAPRITVAEPAPTPGAMADFAALLAAAERPFLAVGGSRWAAADRDALHDFATRLNLPVGATFRRQYLFDNTADQYAGDIGLGINPALRQRIEDSDLLILLGCRFSENPSQSFDLLGIPNHRAKLVHIHPGAEELGRIYTPDLAINATPGAFLDAARAIPERGTDDEARAANRDYRAWTDTLPEVPGPVQMGEVIGHLRGALPADAILTNGAGNYAIWLNRFWRFCGFDTYLGPTSGSMGYGLPAAVAAKLRHPDRPVVCFAGDGCFQMSSQEFGTAAQHGAAVVVLVIDNGTYGTIRMHQERDYPARVSGTDIVNPDFAAIARAYGGHGETVAAAGEFGPAFDRALAAGKPAIVHIKTNVEAITPTTTISALRAKAR